MARFPRRAPLSCAMGARRTLGRRWPHQRTRPRIASCWFQQHRPISMCRWRLGLTGQKACHWPRPRPRQTHPPGSRWHRTKDLLTCTAHDAGVPLSAGGEIRAGAIDHHDDHATIVILNEPGQIIPIGSTTRPSSYSCRHDTLIPWPPISLPSTSLFSCPLSTVNLAGVPPFSICRKSPATRMRDPGTFQSGSGHRGRERRIGVCRRHRATSSERGFRENRSGSKKTRQRGSGGVLSAR